MTTVLAPKLCPAIPGPDFPPSDQIRFSFKLMGIDSRLDKLHEAIRPCGPIPLDGSPFLGYHKPIMSGTPPQSLCTSVRRRNGPANRHIKDHRTSTPK